jgi:hypothetical protein
MDVTTWKNLMQMAAIKAVGAQLGPTCLLCQPRMIMMMEKLVE